MTPDDIASRARHRLGAEVGAIFCNTRRGRPEICTVCTGPAAAPLCPQCRDHRAAFGRRLANLVVPLTYAKAKMRPIHQSEHHMYAYKAQPPAPRCVKHLSLMVLAATRLHGPCIARAAGSSWDAVTFVPSVNRPGPDHPVAELARQVVSGERLRLELGPGARQVQRAPREDAFVVPAAFAERVAARHVLVVEDTWVSGAKVQSAAIALKAAGARFVTVLCVARWLRHDWPDHRALIETVAEPYDAAVCPVTGGLCPQ